MQIVPLYAAALSLLFIFLSVRIIRLRRSLKIGTGDGKNENMMRAIRVHANFSEYVPLAVILLVFLELQNAHSVILHALCLLLLVGRSLHAYGLSQENEKLVFRISGMAMTFTTIFSCAFYIILSAL